MTSTHSSSGDVNRRSFLKASVAVGASAATLSETVQPDSVQAAYWPKPPREISIGSRRELFIDGHLIERLKGEARQELHNPVARDLAIVHDAPWEGTSCGYHTVFQDGYLYRISLPGQ